MEGLSWVVDGCWLLQLGLAMCSRLGFPISWLRILQTHRLLHRNTLHPAPGFRAAGSLVRALEEAGIGRPSTYAPTIQLLQQRGWVLWGRGEGAVAGWVDSVIS